MGFGPYFRPGAVVTTERPGFLRVRVSDDITANGYVAVYLDTGTQIVVRSRDVLALDAATERPPLSACAHEER